ncbi:hypothetical protein COCNU_08G003090 [Cocos nucifera]|uniref:Cation/H+ exchanger domain-containing protein n=1 Tax=Cocos nucifera TaxID=13894 RepID=A0A8K0IH06_COCNU|nr:hypothetical protein COCNU_08G003090 [Cocos nucifera]
MGESLWYCYWPEAIKTPSYWQSPTIVTDFMLPAYLVLLVAVIVTIQTVEFLLKRLHQPRVVAEILSGVLLGPSVLGQFFPNVYRLPPEQNYGILSTVASFALLFYVFTVGLELDVNALRELGKNALTLAVAGMALPFAVSSVAIYLLDLQPLLSRRSVEPLVFHIFFGISVSISGFSVLARMITELKLLSSSVGPLAMASAVISSMLSFMLLAVCVAFSVRREDEVSMEAIVHNDFFTVMTVASALATVVAAPVVTLTYKQSRPHHTADGELVEGNPNVRTVNMNILSDPPCTVAIFIDRLPGGVKRFCTHRSVAVLFFSGPNDREALAYAARMAEHPGINLTVVRFVEGASSVPATPRHESPEEESLERDLQRTRDEEMLNEFRMRFVSDETVLYTEKVASNSEETVAVTYDLYVVGRGRRVASPLTAGLEEWAECPELGPIGDLLISADFGMVSVLVMMQQHAGKGTAGDSAGAAPPAFQNF